VFNSPNSRNVFCWSTPGLLTVVTFALVSLSHVVDVVYGMFAMPLALTWWVGGAVAPITSLGGSILAVRSRRRFHVAACAGSWAGGMLFWGHVTGYLFLPWL
jgi:hypothetical protein